MKTVTVQAGSTASNDRIYGGIKRGLENEAF